MALTVPLKSVERIVFRSEVVAAAKFRCPVSHPLFRNSGPCSNHTFVFPRTITSISRSDGSRFVGSPNIVVFYNQFESYEREAVSAMDASDWYVVADDVLREMIATFDSAVYDRPDRPFRFAFTPVATDAYVQQRALFARLAECDADDALEVEEQVLRLLTQVLATAYDRVPPAPDAALRDAVVDAQRAICRNSGSTLSLRDLAARTGVSPFQLCRAFRRFAGTTMTAYRNELRIRIAVDRLRDRRTDLADLAFALGFSSHSHFTLMFRRAVGITPSAYRDGQSTRSSSASASRRASG
jgi:AraC-like DNA-binding protein